ncbi:hypothetical protein ACOV1W_03795 [Paraclostridium bifermentans]|uniref:hypothetical protein n=1 Tax=Paraclostridium bifermentans TaxID=1490 RepID=UPI003D2E0ED1
MKYIKSILSIIIIAMPILKFRGYIDTATPFMFTGLAGINFINVWKHRKEEKQKAVMIISIGAVFIGVVGTCIMFLN